jgi:hypothetical protein
MAFFVRTAMADFLRHPGEQPEIDRGFIFIEKPYEAAHYPSSIM